MRWLKGSSLLFSLRNTGWKHAAPIMDGMIMHMEYVV